MNDLSTAGIIAIIFGAAILARLVLSRVVTASRVGPQALLGRKKLEIDAFKNGVLYRNGKFERVVPGGVHWINAKGVRVTTVEMRPHVVRLVEAVTTSDRRRARLSMLIRIQVVDARAAVECASNYRDEHLSLILAAVRKLALEWSFRELNLRQVEFSKLGHTLANDALKQSGGACISFELLEVESLGEAPETDDRDIGFKTH